MNPIPSECPVCHDTLLVTQLICPDCGTEIRNRFEMDPLLQLMPEQRHFVEVFLLCEGKLNCVQEELGISYPTVRSRLDEIVSMVEGALSRASEPEAQVEAPPPPAPEPTPHPQQQTVLDRLARNEISAEEALHLLEDA
jgi:hypothetical protein